MFGDMLVGRSARRRARAADRRVGREPDDLEHALPAARQRGPQGAARGSSSSILGAPAWPSAPIATSRPCRAPTWCSPRRWPRSSTGPGSSTVRSSTAHAAAWTSSSTPRGRGRPSAAEKICGVAAADIDRLRRGARRVAAGVPAASGGGSSGTATAARPAWRRSPCRVLTGQFGVLGSGIYASLERGRAARDRTARRRRNAAHRRVPVTST